ncbi:hypothetical protein CICLE_v10013210mg [Citrus x clementina]|uniref:Uncharacterized protein n=1 Tax=Citrus clementina TaxID=85681 RepID=V4UR10_CITCL|nr:hypothetical protein CICLE_v10013210mg [Citrus x clementina]
MVMYNSFYTKTKTMIWVIFMFTNRKRIFKSPLKSLRNALRKFVTVTNKMLGKQLESTTIGTDVRVLTNLMSVNKYRRQPRTPLLAIEPRAK